MNFNDEYRNSNDYKTMMAFIKNINPSLEDYFCEMVMMAHLANPKAYKTKEKPKVEVTEKPQSIYHNVEIISQ